MFAQQSDSQPSSQPLAGALSASRPLAPTDVHGAGLAPSLCSCPRPHLDDDDLGEGGAEQTPGVNSECEHTCRDKAVCKHQCCKRHLAYQAPAMCGISGGSLLSAKAQLEGDESDAGLRQPTRCPDGSRSIPSTEAQQQKATARAVVAVPDESAAASGSSQDSSDRTATHVEAPAANEECGHKCHDKAACGHACCKRHLDTLPASSNPDPVASSSLASKDPGLSKASAAAPLQRDSLELLESGEHQAPTGATGSPRVEVCHDDSWEVVSRKLKVIQD